MLSLVILYLVIFVHFPAEVCGALYLLEGGDKIELKCNESFSKNQKAVWYETGNYSYQLEIMSKTNACTLKKRQAPVSGVFACHSFNDTEFCQSVPPSVKIVHICEYDFFVVIKRNEERRTQKDERNSITDSADLLKRSEGTNITLPCKFTTDSLHFILYWIRIALQTQCLYSVAADSEARFNEHCCVQREPIRRIYNHSELHISAKIQKHDIEIRNATPSDSGQYLCVGARLVKQTYQWEIVRNISLHVEKKDGTSGGDEDLPDNEHWKPVLIAIGSVALIGGLLGCFILLKRKKSKGNDVTGSFRNTDHPGTLENDECSPYAVGMKDKDDSAPETYYSTVKERSAPEYSMLQANTATAPKSGAEISTVYALAQA